VLVSEVMLQQTPVPRVLPAYDAWLARWPTATDLADAPSGEAVRQWGRLGYPRRALRLHQACVVVRDRYAGQVPRTVADLQALPGVGRYTAAAVAAFAWRQRVPVVDVNVARVVSRAVLGEADGPAAVQARQLDAVEALLPPAGEQAARASVALMELGALVCTARAPRCGICPAAAGCVWRQAGSPVDPGAAPRRGQGYAGTDRQCRGRLLAVLREAEGAVPPEALEAGWDDVAQRDRALAGLLADGLAVARADGTLSLPD
jgi:A/G-specific adenine glycosylase